MSVFVGSLLGLLGCAGDTATNATTPSTTTAFWALQLNQHAIMLAQGDTMRLMARPVNAFGAPLTGLGPATFTSPDLDSLVTVSATGLVTARRVPTESQPTIVVAKLTDLVHGITHVDTAFILVTQTPAPSLVSFSMQPTNGDSAKRGLPSGTQIDDISWRPTVVDANNTTVCSTQGSCSILVHYTSSNPSLAFIDPRTGAVTANDTGHVVLTAETWAYGVALRDSVNFQIGLGTLRIVIIRAGDILTTKAIVGPPKLTVGVGATVVFENFVVFRGIPSRVTFSDSVHVDSAQNPFLPPPSYSGSGNISFNGPPSFSELLKARRFPIPGIYFWQISFDRSKTYEIDVQHD